MTTQWIILRRWHTGLRHLPWQPACQLTFDTQEAATAHMLNLEPDFPGREFKVVETNKS